MSEKTTRVNFWENEWKEERTDWHISQVNPRLLNFSSKLFENRTDLRVFVPLCGKTVDMLWLYQQGHTVIGVEAVEEGPVSFFKEQDLPYEESECCVTKAKVLKSLDGRISIFVCDLFNLDPRAFQGKFDAMWDRGSLVAIDREDREQYVDLVKLLMKPDYRILLETVVYSEDEEFKGPPRRMTQEMVQKLYGESAAVELLTTLDLSGSGLAKDLGVYNQLLLQCLLIQPK